MAVAVVLWVTALVAFAIPLRHALVATQAYRAGYWATITDGRELDDFAWKDPTGQTLHGSVEGVPEDGVWDEEGEGTSDITGDRVWVSRNGVAHISESPVEKDMVVGYAGAGAVGGIALLVLRARYGRRTEGLERNNTPSLWSLKGR
ncbi:hypothetical protein ACIG3E_23945 [Streptomyces sp. NPDC053474]|uniref:hypothetical protein n=1 Tax=Streptomyces sp. NPDC053474 TaxID=3365704 RepID=UPI0037CE1D61